MKSSTYYFHMKPNILADFQICISVPLMTVQNIHRQNSHQLYDQVLLLIHESVINHKTQLALIIF